jgi:putative Holliday junction resolvase
MKALGLDLGNRTLGVAVSDTLGFLARPLETFRFPDKSFELALKRTKELVKELEIEIVILGYPKNMDGTVGEQGKISETFLNDLKTKLTIPIVLWDERLTSKMASNMMKQQNLSRRKRKVDIDAMAATIILQSYLDNQK